MKSVVQPCVRSSHPGIKADSCRMAGKSSAIKPDFDSTEMRACFSKLQKLVPNAQCRDGKADRTELLQSVIDYIYHLEDTLAFSSSGLCGLLDGSLVSRQALGDQSAKSGSDYLTLSSSVDCELRPPSQ